MSVSLSVGLGTLLAGLPGLGQGRDYVPIAALFVIHLISYVFELPVLRHLDSLAGGIFGLIRGYITLVIIFLLVPIVLAVAPIEQISRVFEESTLRPMFDSRLIFSILGIGG